MERCLIKVRLCCRGYCDKEHDQKQVSTHPVVLPYSLCIFNPTVQAWRVVLCNADGRLDDEQYICYQAKYGMRGFEVVPVVEFVVHNHDESGDEGEESCAVENGVDACALFLLLWSMCGLENEDSLGD